MSVAVRNAKRFQNPVTHFSIDHVVFCGYLVRKLGVVPLKVVIHHVFEAEARIGTYSALLNNFARVTPERYFSAVLVPPHYLVLAPAWFLLVRPTVKVARVHFQGFFVACDVVGLQTARSHCFHERTFVLECTNETVLNQSEQSLGGWFPTQLGRGGHGKTYRAFFLLTPP
jgi:hypothetical protein